MIHPLVTIITPSYNQGQYLEETILSVLNQDYDNIEYIVIDGGSSDNSLDIIKKYSLKLAFWISEPDKGQADAINKGLARANGEYICWINSDDLIYPNFISTRILQFQNNSDIDFIYGDVDQGIDPVNSWIRKGKKTSFQTILKTLDVPIPQQSALWRSTVIEKTGMLDQKWHVLLDMDYFIRISRNHRISYIPGALAFFRVHKQSKSINEATKWADELQVYYLSLIKTWSEYSKHSRRVMANCYWFCSNIYYENNNFDLAKEYIEKVKVECFFIFARRRLIQSLVKIKKRLFRSKYQ